MTGLDLLTGEIAILVPALQDRPSVAVGVELATHDIALRNQRAQIVAAIVGITRDAFSAGPAGARHFRRVDAVEPRSTERLTPDIVAIVDIWPGARHGIGPIPLRRLGAAG
nr:hypothetical protein [Hephaestia caeni]